MFHLQLFGWPGVGKETIARQIADETGAFLFRNHYAADVAFAMLPEETPPDDVFWDTLADINKMLENIVHANRREQSIIYTNYLTEDPSEWVKLRRRQETANSIGAKFFLIRLDCDESENDLRIESESRAGAKMRSTDKLKSHKATQSLLQAESQGIEIDLCLDVSKLTAIESSNTILNLIHK